MRKKKGNNREIEITVFCPLPVLQPFLSFGYFFLFFFCFHRPATKTKEIYRQRSLERITQKWSVKKAGVKETPRSI